MFEVKSKWASKKVDTMEQAMKYANRLHEVGRPVVVTDLRSGEVVIAWSEWRFW